MQENLSQVCGCPIRATPSKSGRKGTIFRFAQSMGKPFVVDNRPGAGGVVGTEYVSRSAPDGYTLLVVSPDHATNPSMFPKISYNTERDFAPVSLIAGSSYMLVTHPNLPVRSVRELIAYVKERPGQLNFASRTSTGCRY